MGVSCVIPIFLLFYALVVRYQFSVVKEIHLVTMEDGLRKFYRKENYEGYSATESL
jgi:hypothetical protein